MCGPCCSSSNSSYDKLANEEEEEDLFRDKSVSLIDHIRLLHKQTKRQLTIENLPEHEQMAFLHDMYKIMLILSAGTLALSFGLEHWIPHGTSDAENAIMITQPLLVLLIRKLSFFRTKRIWLQAIGIVVVIVSASFFVVGTHRVSNLTVFSNTILILVITLLALLFNPLYYYLRKQEKRTKLYEQNTTCCGSNYLLLAFLYVVPLTILTGYLILSWMFEENGQHMSLREWVVPPPNAVYILLNFGLAIIIILGMFLFVAATMSTSKPGEEVNAAVEVFSRTLFVITLLMYMLSQRNPCSCRKCC